MKPDLESSPHARIPADVSTPDKIIYGLTARQALIFAVAAVGCYVLYRTLNPLLAPVAAVGVLIPVAGAAMVVALGRRDGLPLDVWLLAALRHHQTPKYAVAAADATVTPPPVWAPDLPKAAGPAPAVLRLPASHIGDDGVIDLGNQAAATMVAATTVNIGLRTGEEQWALLGGYGRWLNALSGPVQIVISTQRADLPGHATRIADAAATLPSPALADAAAGYAEFLLDIAARRDPLARTVTVVAVATGRNAALDAARRGQHTAAALADLGADTRVLDGGAVTAVVSAATDPYQCGDASWRRTPPGLPVTVAQGYRS